MNLLIKAVICFFAGAAAGLGTGFAGMSAASVIGPILTVFLNIPPYQAVGVGLASDVLASFISAWTYKKNGNLDVKNSLVLLACVLLMTVVGSYVGKLIPPRTMGLSMQIALILLGLRFIIKPINKTKEQMNQVSTKARYIKSAIGGCIVGFICGFIGAGGGMMLLFVLTSFLGYEMHMAVGTSVFIMAFTALTGSISHFTIGKVPDLWTLGFCIIFTLIWAQIASVLANKASSKTLNRVVGVVLILTSVVIIVCSRLPGFNSLSF